MPAKGFFVASHVGPILCGVENPDIPGQYCDRAPHLGRRHWMLVCVEEDAWSDWYCDEVSAPRMIEVDTNGRL